MSSNHKNSSNVSHSRGGIPEPVRQAAADLKHDAETLGRHAKEAIQEGATQVREKAQRTAAELKDAAQEKVEQLSGDAHDAYEGGRRQMQDLERTLESRIRENPLTSLGIAAGAGFLIGALWSRR